MRKPVVEGENMTKNNKLKPITIKPSRPASAPKRMPARPRAAKLSRPSNPTFGSVSTINTAPVAIGNSMSGFKSRTIPVPNGIRIIGRDYGFTPAATGSVTGWACTGGMPLTPACMPTTVLRNFVQMYSKFKFNSLTAHYITSSSTSTTGVVVFYSQKEAKSSQINWTASSFLPFVLSEPENVIGPQWTNHSMTIRPKGGFKHCDAFLNSDQNDDSFGDIFLMSKTSSTESPGYVVLDYDITFMELEYNPRAALIPLAAAQWNPFDLTWTEARTTDDTGQNSGSATTGIGATTITKFTAANVGDVYKIFIDATNSTFTVGTAANLWNEQLYTGATTAVTLVDGFTAYAVNIVGDTWHFYPTLESAMVNSREFRAGATLTYNVSLRGFAKYVASINNLKMQYNV